MRIRIQGLWRVLAAMILIFSMPLLDDFMSVAARGGEGLGSSIVVRVVGSLLILVLLGRWATDWEVRDSLLKLKSPFSSRSFPIPGSVICESNWPWLFRMRTADGRVHTLPLPDESVYGEPAKELLLSILEGEGACVLHASWRLPKGDDPAASFRPKRDSFCDLMFWLQVVLLLSITVLLFLVLSDHVAWWILAPLALVAVVLVHQQLPKERRNFLTDWRLRHPKLTPDQALASLITEEGIQGVASEDLEGSQLVRQLGRNDRGTRVSRLMLLTQNGKSGATRWTETVVGGELREPLLSAGAEYKVEELAGVVAKEVPT